MRHLPLLLTLLAAPAAYATSPVLYLDVSAEPIVGGKPIPEKHALCIPTADGKSGPGENIRPTIRWGDAPAGTQSFAILVTDPDVPASFDDAGKEGRVVAAEAPRQLFYHWGAYNIPATATALEGGDATLPLSLGTEVPNSLGSYVKRPGQFGGPCPPWNDERLHHYHFRVIALDVPTLALSAAPTTAELAEAVKGHILAENEVVGTYTLNPKLRQ